MSERKKRSTKEEDRIAHEYWSILESERYRVVRERHAKEFMRILSESFLNVVHAREK